MTLASHWNRRASFDDRVRVRIRGSFTAGETQRRCALRFGKFYAAGCVHSCVLSGVHVYSTGVGFWLSHLYIPWKMTTTCESNANTRCHPLIHNISLCRLKNLCQHRTLQSFISTTGSRSVLSDLQLIGSRSCEPCPVAWKAPGETRRPSNQGSQCNLRDNNSPIWPRRHVPSDFLRLSVQHIRRAEWQHRGSGTRSSNILSLSPCPYLPGAQSVVAAVAGAGCISATWRVSTIIASQAIVRNNRLSLRGTNNETVLSGRTPQLAPDSNIISNFSLLSWNRTSQPVTIYIC